MDIKANFFVNPMKPVYQPATPGAPHPVPAAPQWIEFDAGLHEIGATNEGFAFDNERPRHRVFIEAFAIAPRLVTNGEYLAFIEAGGYRQAQWWLSDGWRWLNEKHIGAPAYWERIEGTQNSGHWHEFTLSGLLPLDLNAPVCHVSFYEAEAYAHWAGARLATEAELEIALAAKPVIGNFADNGRLQPAPVGSFAAEQWYGDAWAWTRSAYAPYPGFQALAGSLGEYNGKFMSNQFVLRGGCCATPRTHVRATYRNFFYAPDRWPFTGIRLARQG
jgi:ergothioneine biosynthesis protein EgtB